MIKPFSLLPVQHIVPFFHSPSGATVREGPSTPFTGVSGSRVGETSTGGAFGPLGGPIGIPRIAALSRRLISISICISGPTT